MCEITAGLAANKPDPIYMMMNVCQEATRLAHWAREADMEAIAVKLDDVVEAAFVQFMELRRVQSRRR